MSGITNESDRTPTSRGPAPTPKASAQTIARLCSDVAGSSIGVDDDMFEAGLNSLDLVRLAAAVQQQCGIRLNALSFVDHPTARQLADHINGSGRDDHA
ncbi:acyl carrier protein [Micromonospora sp. WMMA1976]|uniref:acyl carrier protein n=1 Tax=Micromonospora sp. WMMA1976 TaxID=3014995 RepID=UPI00248B447D|nr:acyl carrier protein [Micromonospora sp. WMMA1976]WBC01107.1 acyl carrier protein [Micromonospora sp. WMMA1976]